MSNNPYEMPPGGFSPPGSGPGTGAALSKVSPPAIGLMVVGVINILLSIYGVIMSGLVLAGIFDPNAAQREQFEEMAAQGGQEAEMAEMMMNIMTVTQGPVGLVTNLIALIVGAIIVFGALKMKNLQSYGLALTSAIVAMIPCLSSCCLVGLPIGIWALVVLLDNNVKQSFR